MLKKNVITEAIGGWRALRAGQQVCTLFNLNKLYTFFSDTILIGTIYRSSLTSNFQKRCFFSTLSNPFLSRVQIPTRQSLKNKSSLPLIWKKCLVKCCPLYYDHFNAINTRLRHNACNISRHMIWEAYLHCGLCPWLTDLLFLIFMLQPCQATLFIFETNLQFRKPKLCCVLVCFG